MKGKTLVLLVATIGLTSGLHGQGAPRGSFTGGEFEQAKAKAIEEQKPIAIITTELNSSCPKCVNGNEEVFKQMRSDYVLVIDDGKAKEKLPEEVKRKTYPIYKSKGNTMPIIAVLSNSDQTLLGGLSYKQISADARKAFKALDAEVAAAMTAAPAATTSPQAKQAREMRDWTNSEGKTIKAELVSSDDTSVTLKLESGKFVDYPLEKLSEESRALIEKISKSD